ncbi:hypothetical protein DICPUDRAFT_78653 [Dictyostelium purpureum]|uniref:Sacsin/Nov domain-containing protein n=1 Tax=Dictyostelium purpureum TaxID=5786 RepID=F0ZK56_DICPU|nr:uncharacterized protein DICPUDRAFT_78653 [Dictyostelium purpureum]EGC35672.1 hypothetical protein DICPUDRAFT_78653 [Dictyostelium purpureum]|eukprot:XP_003287805.1 hypothetical protein DICPUDRAFT_78653 [Dictyostelium purpureum]
MVIKQRNQKLDITTGIRNNLAKYQESKIFREIVQNAEDAGANEIIIKLDLNTYGSKKLFFKEGDEFYNNLKDLQGPSIIIYNNGVFKDSDWEGIEYIGEGSKKKDMLSIGNFGLGFNSTYHITDCPQIISGKKLWFLDPVKLIKEGIECADFTAENYEEYEDQFKPFEQFGCTMKSFFEGTIIRLPLRLRGNKIKEKPLSIKDCEKILEEFYKEMLEIPIFLKVISSITLETGSNFIFKVQVKNHDQVQNERKKVDEHLKTIVNYEMKDKTDNYEFNTIISKKNQNDFKSIYQLEMETSLNNNDEIKTNEISFIVSQGILVSNELNSLVIDSEIKLVSYGGVAIPITNNNGTIEVYDKEFQGKPFCFLPIGNQKISSKAHVFGYYILSDARSEIQYTSQSNLVYTQEYKINKWNHFVSESVIPFFYKEALNYMTSFNIDLISYFPYHCLVNKSSNSSAEIDFSIHTMEYIMKSNLFFTVSERYCSLRNSIIVKGSTQQFILDYLEGTGSNVILLNDSFINYLSKNGFKVGLISPKLLCSELSKNQLAEYSEDILDYLCSDNSVIIDGLLNNLQIFPINHLNSTKLDSLQTNHSLSKTQPFIVVSDEIYQLFIDMNCNVDYVLNTSKLCPNVNENINLIKKFYVNFQIIDIVSFLNRLNIKTASDHQKTIWKLIESFNNLHSNTPKVNELISKLPIFPYKNKQSSKINYISFNDPRAFSNHLTSDEKYRSILEKLNFIIIDNHGPSKIFLDIYETLERSLSKIFTTIKNIKSLEELLSPEEISTLRQYLFNLLNQCYHQFDKWGKFNTNAFFAIPIHECIGIIGQQFTSISEKSICSKISNIRNYEIIGKGIVLIENYIYDNIQLPTKSIYKNETELHLNYLLPNLPRFPNLQSIEIIKNFVNKYLYGLNKNEITKSNWILTNDNKYINISKFYHLSDEEMDICNLIDPQLVINDSLRSISDHLFKLKLINNISKSRVIDATAKYLQKHPFNDELYNLFLDYTNQLSKNEIKTELDKINKIKFISSSKVETYPGFEPKTPTISLSEATILEHKDIKFSIKYPIKFEKTSTIYQYLKDDNQTVFDHWYKLLKNWGNITNKIDGATIFDSIYRNVSKIKKLSDQQTKCLEEIEKCNALWFGNELFSIDRLYMEGDYIFTPFYYKVNLSVYPIFKQFNMFKKKLVPNDYYNIITDIQNQNDINDHLIGIYCICLKFISYERNESFKKENIKLLPTISNKLVEFNKVVFSETPLEDEEYFQLNKSIDILTVEKLEILKFSQITQEKVALPFGQKEEIVPRLQGLIKDYRTESFFNEMIQNASDANATEVKIFMDRNSYKSDYIKPKDVPNIENYLSNSLLFYNNSIFTDRDIESVQRISSSYKKQDQSTIGFNGLGINSAYNFSNVITILSGKYLMILDPFISHIPVSKSRSTGAKLEIIKDFNRNDRKDFFKPFLNYKKLFNIDFDQGEFKGTIIRLPLRKNMKKENNISEAFYSYEKVLKLFKDLADNNLHNCMLFTNIRDIEIGSLIQDDYSLFYKTTKQTPKPIEQRKTIEVLDVIPMDLTEQNFLIIDKTIQQKETKRFIVGSTTVFENNEEFLNKLPEYSKTRKFLTMYTDEKRKPYGSIAFEISDIDGSYIKQKSKSFCYLPFKDIDLPIHVNGFFSMTTARDIFETNKSINLKLEDPLKRVVDKTVQKQESFLIYWNTLLIEDLITPIFIKSLILYKEKYIANESHPDFNVYFKLLKSFYHLFPLDIPHSTSIFQKLTLRFYLISKLMKIDFLIPHPNYYDRNNPDSFLLSIDGTHKPSNSILKCFSNYGSIFFITDKLCESLDLKDLYISPELLSKTIKSKSLNSDILNNIECLIDIITYLGPYLSDDCQLLKLNNGAVEFVNKKETLIFNQEYYGLLKNNQKINKDEIFLDREFSEKLFSLTKWNSNKIIQLDPIQFFFKIIYPNYESFSLEDIKNILNFLKNCFYRNGRFEMVSFKENQYNLLKQSKLIPSKTNDIVQLRSITELYSFEFKNMFNLLYPLDCFNTQEWKQIFEEFGIKTHLDKENIESEFKRLSNDFYKLPSEESEDYRAKRKELLNKSYYLWTIVMKLHYSSKDSYKDLFNSIIELNILPTKSSDLFGKKSPVPFLGRINNCYISEHENLCYTIKYPSDIVIPFPNDYNPITNEEVFENLINNQQSQPMAKKK